MVPDSIAQIYLSSTLLESPCFPSYLQQRTTTDMAERSASWKINSLPVTIKLRQHLRPPALCTAPASRELTSSSTLMARGKEWKGKRIGGREGPDGLGLASPSAARFYDFFSLLSSSLSNLDTLHGKVACFLRSQIGVLEPVANGSDGAVNAHNAPGAVCRDIQVECHGAHGCLKHIDGRLLRQHNIAECWDELPWRAARRSNAMKTKRR